MTALASVIAAVRRGLFMTALADGFGAPLANRMLMQRGFRVLASTPVEAKGTGTSRRLAHLIARPRTSRYLEIGLSVGDTFEAVPAAVRVGVDPDPRFVPSPLPRGARVLAIPSDRFFGEWDRDEEPFDAILVDGLHEFEQCYRDIINSLQVLGPQGFILVDDVVPVSEAAAGRDVLPSGQWMGDVFRAAHVIAHHHPELGYATIVSPDMRPQMLIWRRGGTDSTPAGESAMAAALELSYTDVFADGIPGWFRTCSLEEAGRLLPLGGSD